MFGPPTPAYSESIKLTARYIGKGDDFPAGQGDADVAGAAQAVILGADDAQAIFSRDVRGAIVGPVVDDDNFVVRILERAESIKAIADRLRAVVRTDYDGHPRPRGLRRKRHLGVGKDFADRGQGGLRPSSAVCEPKAPVLDVLSAAMPFVGPGEHKRAGAAACKRTPHLPLQHVGLALLAEPLTVDTDLSEQQWAVPRDVVESRQIGLQTIAFLEIDIEC